jgi:hypothetical protein
MSAARKAETFPIQILALSQIIVDHAIQSRVATNIEFQREFSEAMLRGDVFPPVTVFFDGKKYWLADGFHRHGAVKQLARTDKRFAGIRAEIRNGSRRDAAIFSAGANQKFSIKRSHDDIKKALSIMFTDDEWANRCNREIAQHCGVNPATVIRRRKEFCVERGIDLPSEIEYTQQGNKRSCSRSEVTRFAHIGLESRRSAANRVIAVASGVAEFTPSVSGRAPHSGVNRADAIAEARRIGDSSEGDGWRRLLWRMADLLEQEASK